MDRHGQTRKDGQIDIERHRHTDRHFDLILDLHFSRIWISLPIFIPSTQYYSLRINLDNPFYVGHKRVSCVEMKYVGGLV